MATKTGSKSASQKGAAFGFNPLDDLNDLRMSEQALPLLEHVKRFIKETVQPMSEEFHRLGEGRADRWSYAPGQLELLEAAKDKAKKEGSGTSSCPTRKPAKVSRTSITPISLLNSAKSRSLQR